MALFRDSDDSDVSLSESSDEDTMEFDSFDAAAGPEAPCDFAAPAAFSVIGHLLQREDHGLAIEPGAIERLHGPRIRGLRVLLGHWLFNLSFVYPSTTEALYQCVSLFDRFLARRPVAVHDLQLVCCCCMWIAAKVEVQATASLDPLVALCHGKFSRAEFVRAEAEILSAVDYDVHTVTPYVFLRALLEEARVDAGVALVASFLCECTLLSLEASCCRPSVVAFAAIALAFCATGRTDYAAGIAAFARHFAREDVCYCAGVIVRAGRAAAGHAGNAVRRKYAAQEVGGVPGAGARLIEAAR